ncbi:sensor histidine kinase [Mucilaginibacter sp. SP1R1]|uniref:sensor histidine kinase n=1 Tax=Mucilaginibacter sp. SP1R1 TaxID=2723091 RepID=UPI00161B68D0|nr:histidine kinase [Mucilaginibacter sp. SP1R1]MBB6148554.1 sensor histidine kinase YesM [Mucilaginibacter sp. SP1R1]
MKNTKFRISPGIIWISSIFLGLLSSVPQIAERHFNPAEAAVNSSITFLFALFVWYYNIYTLPGHYNKQGNSSFSYFRLLSSLLLGIAVMLALASIQQLILSHINFGPVMLMVEVRGILINLVFYMFLHLLYQNYRNQQVNIELERTKADNLGAQYELLKQQVNPHFLFNSLNTLKAMVETDDKNTVDFILKLSNFYRFTLESRKLDLIHLSEEMEIVEAYNFLLKARFEDGFTFTNTINEKYMGTLIPPFTLQLLIENCIKHNIVSLEHPLHIKIYDENDSLVIENPLQLKRSDESSLGVGLSNINLRYSHLLEKHIEIIKTDNTFKIKLPLIHEHYHH